MFKEKIVAVAIDEYAASWVCTGMNKAEKTGQQYTGDNFCFASVGDWIFLSAFAGQAERGEFWIGDEKEGHNDGFCQWFASNVPSIYANAFILC